MSLNRYEVCVKNCTSFEKADIIIYPGILNIKYGPNGVGKSSIARAIQASSSSTGSLAHLKPFKHRSDDTSPPPSITGAEQIKSVLVFNEDYVNKVVFQKDEVLKNSFDVFIKTDEFISSMAEISESFQGVVQALSNNQELNSAIIDLTTLKEAFSFTSTGSVSKASKGYKALDGGNGIVNIPDELTEYTKFLQSEQPSKWISWQKLGNEFIDISENCPYCATNISEKKKVPLLVKEKYDSKQVDQLGKLQTAIDKLGDYFTEECKEDIESIVNGKVKIDKNSQVFLLSLNSEINELLRIFGSLNSLSFFSFRDMEVDKIDEWLHENTIKLSRLPNLNSDKTKLVVEPINSKLNDLINTVSALKGKIGRQKSSIQRTISKNISLINDFLKTAGYRYRVEVFPEKDSYKMRLFHVDFNKPIENAVDHLSFGERNAFSLILFMYQAFRERPDLIVLDDPISSFDNNKKFAIIHKLFQGDSSFRGMTVLMLTHDIEPAIDMIRVNGVRGRFQAMQPNAFFLENKSGFISEKPITRNCLKTFSSVCKENIALSSDDIIKLVYLRRLQEILDESSKMYHFISNALHAKATPQLRSFDNSTGEITETPFSESEILALESEIGELIPNFSYKTIVGRVNDIEDMREVFNRLTNGYEKLQIFRMICETNDDILPNDVIKKFINETFHIENEYLMQLNPKDFDPIPEYVTDECIRIISDNFNG